MFLLLGRIAACGLFLHTELRGLSVCLSVTVSLLVTIVNPAKTARQIEISRGWMTRVGPRNHVLDGGPDPQGDGRNFPGLSDRLKKINNGISAIAAGRLHCSRLAGVTLPFPREKSAPCNAACRQNSLTTFLLRLHAVDDDDDDDDDEVEVSIAPFRENSPLKSSEWHVLTRHHTVLPATHTFMHAWNEPSCLNSLQSQRITALWPVLISRPTVGRRLGSPGWLVTYRDGRPMTAGRRSPIPVPTDR